MKTDWKSCYHKLNYQTSQILAEAIGAPLYPFLRDCPEIGGKPEDGDKRLNCDTDCAETAEVAAKLIGELRADNGKWKNTAENYKGTLDETNRHVCELCEAVGLKREDVPCDTYALADSILSLRAELDRLRKFTGWVLDTARDPRIGVGGLDGGELQDAMLEHGLLEEFTVETPCNHNWCECSVGDVCYRDTELAINCRVANAKEPKP